MRNFLCTPPPPTFFIINLDVINEIKRLKNKKSPGVSTLINKILKNLPNSYIPRITLLINSLFKFSYFPLYWKTALIAPILNSKKPPKNPISCRLISLLNSFSKLAEAFIAQHLNDHIDNNQIITPDQFGFRKGPSAPHQVYQLVEHITAKINKSPTAAVFLDIEKAFDRVGIYALIYKLIITFLLFLIKLIFHYLLDRNFIVKIKNKLSRNLFAPFGIPQGLSRAFNLIYLLITCQTTLLPTLLNLPTIHVFSLLIEIENLQF